jgi:hypothetical protein
MQVLSSSCKSCHSTLPLAKQMGTLNVMVHWRPSGPNTSVIRPPSEWASCTPRSKTERTWWNAVAFCPLESFASNLGMIPRGHHDHDLVLNFWGMIESVKNRHSIPWQSFLATWVYGPGKNESAENCKRAILNVVGLVCIMIPFCRMNLIKVILVIRRDTWWIVPVN